MAVSQAALAGSMEVISGSSVADHHAPRIPRGPSLRRVSSRTAMKRSCSAPVLAPVWEPDCEELEDVPSFLHSDGVRRRLTCEGSAPTPSRSAPSTRGPSTFRCAPSRSKVHDTPPVSVTVFKLFYGRRLSYRLSNGKYG